MLLEEVERQTSVPESLLPPDPKIEKVCLLGCVKKTTKESTLVYDQNPYFGLGPIPKPKPKLADTFGRYRNRYRNHISKGESSYRVNFALVWGNFSIIKRPIKPNLLPNFKHF